MAQGNRTFVGIGFGPIQSGLFLYEAYMSGNFARYVVAEVDNDLVNAVRSEGMTYSVNIARRDRIESVTLKGVELYNPRDPADREKLISAIAEADEMATALPSVNFFDSGGAASAVAVLGDGIKARTGNKPVVIYAAENHNHAAEILTEKLAAYVPASSLAAVQVLNTVIGKMSCVITDAASIRSLGLATMTPATPRAMLVEEFNRILISRITLPGFQRGIEVLIEKDDLLPFEEAKLYGHNAIHALIGYLSDLRDLPTMAEAARHPDIMAVARNAFLNESGRALIAKYSGLNDPLFTTDGFRAYADDLLDRMVRPNLNDLVSRVIRDHARKLGYDDRLYGTMRLALRHGIQPVNLAQGAAAAVVSMIRRRDSASPSDIPLPRTLSDLTEESLRTLLNHLWAGKTDSHASELVRLTWEGFGCICPVTPGT